MTLALLLLAPHAVRALPYEKDPWIRVETANFTIFSNAPENATREIGQRIETFREVLRRLHPSLAINSPSPTLIYIFKNDDSFTPYKRTYGRTAVAMEGYFIGHRDANYVAINASPQGDPFAPIYHEFVHYFMTNNFPHLPLWFNEGIADCYMTFTVENGKGEVGRPPEDHRQWLRTGRLMPITELFAVDVDSRDYNEQKRQGVFYAESWGLVHLLLYGERGWKSRLPEILARMDQGATVASLVAPMSYEELEKQLTNYVRGGRFVYDLLDLHDLHVDDSVRVSLMPREEALYRLGDFLAHDNPIRAAEAEEHFREAIRINPAHAASYAGLAFVRDAVGDPEKAARLYEKSLELDPGNDLTCFLYATSILDRAIPKGRVRRSAATDASPSLLRSRELLARSIRLRPGRAEAYAEMGSTYSFVSGDLTEGIAALEIARRLLPGRQDVVFNLIALYARSGQRAKAQDVMDNSLSRWHDPHLMAEARETLLEGDLAAADAALRSKDYGEALRLLKGVAVATSDQALKTRLETHIREIEDQQKQNGAITLYNQAVMLARKKDYKGACALLERVVHEAPDAALRDKAKELLGELKQAADAAPRARP